ncbi:MAG TPA: hypothetical protein VMX13_03285 [Sedimentisphaerales bacterium]|nr:hypothetical protein [Sedimentisphaerales bacterium]
MIDFRCSHCGHNFSVPETYAGKTARCSKCHRSLRIPEPSPLPPADETKPTLVTFHCPHCRQKIGVAQRHAGREITCAKCHQTLRVPQPHKDHPPQKASTHIEKDDRMFVQPVSSEHRHDTIHATQTGSPDEEVLHVAPPPVTPDTVRQTKCPQCQSLNRADAQVCHFCGETMSARRAVAPRPSGSIGLAVAASIGLTFGAAAAWVLLAYFAGWFWLQFLAVGVASIAGYGLTLATDKRTPSMGILAMVIGLITVVAAKLIIVYWVVIPQVDSFFGVLTTITDRQADNIIKNPDAMFTFACYSLADELQWDWQFTNEVVMFRTLSSIQQKTPVRPKMPPQDTEKLRQAVKTVEERITAWSDAEKRHAVLSGFERHRQWLNGNFRAIAAADANQPGKAPTPFVKEGIEVAVGERTLSQSPIGRAFTWGGACCLDFIWIPLGLFLAYKIAARR